VHFVLMTDLTERFVFVVSHF